VTLSLSLSLNGENYLIFVRLKSLISEFPSNENAVTTDARNFIRRSLLIEH